MPSSDDTIIISGPLTKFVKWIYNYKIMFGSFGINGLLFLVLTHLLAFVVGKVV